MCTILATVVGRMPDAVLRSKFAPSFAILSAVAERHSDQVRFLTRRHTSPAHRRFPLSKVISAHATHHNCRLPMSPDQFQNLTMLITLPAPAHPCSPRTTTATSRGILRLSRECSTGSDKREPPLTAKQAAVTKAVLGCPVIQQFLV